jgi:hypothetical protein
VPEGDPAVAPFADADHGDVGRVRLDVIDVDATGDRLEGSVTES